MNTFTYENQGSETLLVYSIGENETLDDFAKSMLQSNELAGVLKPLFIQRDEKQYLKYPITSRLPLKEYLQNEMEKKAVLNLCATIVQAVQELEDYMLSPEKVLLDADHIFVDITKKEAYILYLPIDEYACKTSLNEFLLYFLSHMRYRMDGDLSYVAKLIHYLNQAKQLDAHDFQIYVKQLMEAREQKKENNQSAVVRPVEGLSGAGTMPNENIVALETQPDYGSHFENGNTENKQQIFSKQNGYSGQSGYSQVPEFGVGAGNADWPGEDRKTEEKKKKGLFGWKEKKNEKDTQKNQPQNNPNPLGIAVPGMEIPGTCAGTQGNRSIPAPEIELVFDEQGNVLKNQQEKLEKKKGLFGFGKKKKEEKIVKNMMAGTDPAMFPPQSSSEYQDPMMQNPSGGYGAGMSQNSSGGCGMGTFQNPSGSYHQGIARSSAAGQEMVSGSASYNQDEDNRTVFLGGGKDSGATIAIGNGQEAKGASHVVKLTRRRTGQSMTIQKEVFRIGREGSFVDFYIADNPAIGAVHADIYEDDGQFFISDRNSVNHTYVNGQMVAAGQPFPLSTGNVITLADEDFDFVIS